MAYILIEFLQIGRNKLPGSLLGNVDSVFLAYFLRIMMRRLPNMITFGTCGSDLPVQVIPGNQVSHHTFCYWRAADIAETYHQNAHKVVLTKN